ncbi:hypothetical protein E4U56_007176 [Claviceps arundinis]|uniref:Uncharacterized protein n=1 Tax=Claviceps arundinis TaxID=1623583 RepID=A0A9P7MLT5_9HYPO|nr:hypothetical protein E4U56_007176 [Claviceps arundinis]
MPYNKNSAQPNGNKDCNTKYANKKARKQRLALAEVAVEELNALTIADKPLDARKNAVPTATNKDAIVCLKGKGTIVPKNDVVQKKPTKPAEDKDTAVHQKGKGVAVPKHDDAVSQEKSALSAENKDAAVHQKKNGIAVPGHNVVEVQQISTEPAEDTVLTQ